MNNTTKKINGSEIVIQCLKEQGVDTIFGYPGGAILNVYDALYAHPEIRHILTAHEQGASHAADGYARSTGRVGVCFATSGPGATNLTTGVATAYMDSSPVVFITCNVNSDLIGRDSFQEVDIAGVTLPVTKCSYIVSNVTKLADTIREAFVIARSGRPGPVLIDIQKNATAAECEYTPMTPEEFLEHPDYRIARLMKTHHPSVSYPDIDIADIDRLAEMTEGFIGSEIEQVVISALCDAFFENRALKFTDFEKAIENTVPLSRTQKEEILAIRQWANVRAVSASSKENVEKYSNDAEPLGGDNPDITSARGGRRLDI